MLWVSYQEERSVAFVCRMLNISESLTSKTAAGDVQGQGQGHVILRVHQQSQIGAENPPDCCFHLKSNQKNDIKYI